MEQIKLDNRGGGSFVSLLAKFLVTPDTLDYLISPTGKNPKEQEQVNAVVSSLPRTWEWDTLLDGFLFLIGWRGMLTMLLTIFLQPILVNFDQFYIDKVNLKALKSGKRSFGMENTGTLLLQPFQALFPWKFK